MANGALLSGVERKKESETFKERKREEEGVIEEAMEGQRHQISLLIIKSSDTPTTPGEAGLPDQPCVLTIQTSITDSHRETTGERERDENK